MRVLVSSESRKEACIADHTLDHLIRIGLIDREESKVSRPMQQWLRYLAILADRLANSQGVVAKEVRLIIKLIRALLKPCSCLLLRGIMRRKWLPVLNTWRDLTSPCVIPLDWVLVQWRSLFWSSWRSHFVVLKVRRPIGRKRRMTLNQTVGRGFKTSIGRTSGRTNSWLEES